MFKTKRNAVYIAGDKIRVPSDDSGYRLKICLTLKEVHIIPGVSCKMLWE